MADKPVQGQDRSLDGGMLDIGAAGDAIGRMGLLSDADPGEDQDTDSQDAEDEQDEDVLDAESDDGDADEDGDDDEFDDEEDEDDADDGTDALPATLKVKVDGEEQEVTLDEARAGYQRQKDYTRKTMALAERQKELQAKAEELTGLQASYAQQLEVVQRALQVEEPDWAKVKRDNPKEYSDMRDAFDERKRQLEAVQAEMQRTQADYQAQVEAARGRTLEIEQEKLTAAWPEWNDPDTAEAETQKLISAVTTYGFTPGDVAQVVDHRLVLLMRDAARWQDYQERQGKVTDKVRKTRKPGKTLVPGSPDRTPAVKKSSKKQSKAARQKLRESGRIDDAALALTGLL